MSVGTALGFRSSSERGAESRPPTRYAQVVDQTLLAVALLFAAVAPPVQLAVLRPGGGAYLSAAMVALFAFHLCVVAAAALRLAPRTSVIIWTSWESTRRTRPETSPWPLPQRPR